MSAAELRREAEALALEVSRHLTSTSLLAYNAGLLAAILAALTRVHDAATAAERARCAAVCRERAERFKAEAATTAHPFRKVLLLSDAGEALYCAGAIEGNQATGGGVRN